MSWYKKTKLKYFSISTHCGLECKQQSIRLHQVKHTITTSQTYDYNESNIRLQRAKYTISSQTYDYNKPNIRLRQANTRLQQDKHTTTTRQTYD